MRPAEPLLDFSTIDIRCMFHECFNGSDARPKHGGFSARYHRRNVLALVCRIQRGDYFVSEGKWYNHSIVVHVDSVNRTEVFFVMVEFKQRLW